MRTEMKTNCKTESEYSVFIFLFLPGIFDVNTYVSMRTDSNWPRLWVQVPDFDTAAGSYENYKLFLVIEISAICIIMVWPNESLTSRIRRKKGGKKRDQHTFNDVATMQSSPIQESKVRKFL